MFNCFYKKIVDSQELYKNYANRDGEKTFKQVNQTDASRTLHAT